MMRELINAHIISNKEFYTSYCSKLYNRRYLADDLFQEFYLNALNINEDRIRRFHETNRLKYLFIKEIKTLFNQRFRKKTVKAPSSALFETCNSCETNFRFEAAPNYDEQHEKTLDRMHEVITDKIRQEDPNTIIFLQVREEGTISALAKKAGLNRATVGKACNQAKFELRQAIKSNE
jgi:RNA polymerase sigma factor (sigma-70 family)